MTIQKHTPTPWHVVKSHQMPVYVNGTDDLGVCLMDGLLERRDGDAELIVKAVNAHDALVKALEEMLAAHSLGVGVGASQRRIAAKEQARAALAKAGAT